MSDKIVCVDLDGVLAKYEKWEGVEKFGPVIPSALGGGPGRLSC